MSLPLYARHPDFDYGPAIKELKSLGVDHVSVVFEIYLEDLSSSLVFADPVLTPSIKTLQKVIRQVHANNMKVMLFPILILKRTMPFHWRGILKPQDARAWFFSYGNLLSQYARLAENENVAFLCIGSELGSLEGKIHEWQHLIQILRRIYGGKLLYSANWDHYREVSFWNQLDLVGVTGYWPLTFDDNPRKPALVYHLKKAKDNLLTWKKGLKKPLILTEVGYQSRDGVNQRPWDSDFKASLDLHEQYLCYQAFYEVWYRDPQLRGIYFWHWFGDGGLQDGSYSPRGKPAVSMIEKWFLEKNYAEIPFPNEFLF